MHSRSLAEIKGTHKISSPKPLRSMQILHHYSYSLLAMHRFYTCILHLPLLEVLVGHLFVDLGEDTGKALVTCGRRCKGSSSLMVPEQSILLISNPYG